MVNGSDWLALSAAGLGFGLYAFLKGFRTYREYRVLSSTPEAPIRSIATGLVRVHGKAGGDRLAVSPVTHSPCFFYKVIIEQWESGSGRSGSWRHSTIDSGGVKFYLEDSTGRVAVNAEGADGDLIQTARREIGGVRGAFKRLLAMNEDGLARALASNPEASDRELEAYAAKASPGLRNAISIHFGSLSSPWPGGVAGSEWALDHVESAPARLRFTEYCILPGHWFDVTGTCVEDPDPADREHRNLIVKGRSEPTFLISWRSRQGVESRLRRRSALEVFGGAGLMVAGFSFLLARLGWL